MHYDISAEIKSAVGTGEGSGSRDRSTTDNADIKGHEIRKRAGVHTTASEIHSDQTRGIGTPSRKKEAGYSILDNNGVNVLMAAIMSVGAMILASQWWDVSLMTIIR
jgi:hypothetical protein